VKASDQVATAKTPADIEACVALVVAMGGDYEVAHALEDKLHQRVLGLIAHGGLRGAAARAAAAAALQTLQASFPRYCA